MIDIRKMAIDDIDEVVDLIETQDDDDSEDAMNDFKDNGIQYQWVILNKNKIVGTSGFRPVPETENTAFITWTYVHKKFCKKGYACEAVLVQSLDDSSGGISGVGLLYSKQ